MGMFDQEPNLTSQEFASGTFTIEAAEYQGVKEHPQFGANTKGRVRINGKWYSVYGVMADQIARQESGDLPKPVKISKEGQANVLVPAEDGESF